MSSFRLMLAFSVFLLFAGIVVPQADYASVVSVEELSKSFVGLDPKDVSVERFSGREFVTHRPWVIGVSEGRLSINLGLEERGTFLVRLEKPGFKPLEMKFHFRRGQTQKVRVLLEPVDSGDDSSFVRLATLKGLIFDSSGARLEGALVVATGPEGEVQRMVTEANGYYEFALPFQEVFVGNQPKLTSGAEAATSNYQLLVSKTGFQPPIAETIRVVNPEFSLGSLQRDFVLSPVSRFIRLIGNVYDPTGALVQGTSVVIKTQNKVVTRTKTNESGLYAVELVPGEYDIEFESAGFKVKRVTDFKLVNSTLGEIHLDMFLEVMDPEPCGYAGVCPN